MTPEELNRTIDFILQIQARMAARQEKDDELLQQMAVQEKRLSELIEIQSRRLDRADQRLERAEREDGAAQKRHDEFMREIREVIREVRERLDRIFERLDGGTHETS